MVLLAIFAVGFYTLLAGILFKSLVAGLTGTGLMLGSATIVCLPSRPGPKPSQ